MNERGVRLYTRKARLRESHDGTHAARTLRLPILKDHLHPGQRQR
jgi:hypothetical protein